MERSMGMRRQSLSYVLERRSDPGACSAVSSHRIIVHQRKWGIHRYVMMGILLSCFSILVMKTEMQLLHPTMLLGALAFSLAAWRRGVQEEVVVVMPTLGVQFEIFYRSKRVSRRFVPLDKIVAPIINEAVTPVTCYFYLALLVRGEDSLVLPFHTLRPPLEMLVPIWRSISEAVECSSVNPENCAGDVTAERSEPIVVEKTPDESQIQKDHIDRKSPSSTSRGDVG